MKLQRLLWRSDGLGTLFAEANGYSATVSTLSPEGGGRFLVRGTLDQAVVHASGTRASVRDAMLAAEDRMGEGPDATPVSGTRRLGRTARSKIETAVWALIAGFSAQPTTNQSRDFEGDGTPDAQAVSAAHPNRRPPVLAPP
jgi:hypothetical protein